MRYVLPLALLLALSLSACLLDGPGAPSLAVAETVVGVVASAIPVDVIVTDGEAPVPGRTVIGEAVDGTLAQTDVTTDPDGRAQLTWTLGTVAGPQALRIRLDGQDSTTVVMANALPGPATSARFTTSRLVVRAGRPVPLPFAAEDAWGNAVPNPPITSSLAGAQGDVVFGEWPGGAIGYVRFAFGLPGSDTLELFAHPPLGSYRAAFSFSDTIWSETGRFELAGDPPACPVLPDDATVAVYDAHDVVRVRRWNGGADTVQVTVSPAALVHGVRPDVSDPVNTLVFYRPAGFASCAEALLATPWRFAIFARLQELLVITP